MIVATKAEPAITILPTASRREGVLPLKRCHCRLPGGPPFQFLKGLKHQLAIRWRSGLRFDRPRQFVDRLTAIRVFPNCGRCLV